MMTTVFPAWATGRTMEPSANTGNTERKTSLRNVGKS